ncbi:MAG: beta-glucuronidase [Prevotella sp.]|nr:beta-glucuronidase [Candidatus Prevotella equi]
MKRLFLFFTIALLTLTAEAAGLIGKQSIDLSGEWEFMIDRNGVGEKEGWYKPEVSFTGKVKLPGSMPENGLGDNPTVNTKWVCSIYDSSYYFNPYMEKYRQENNFKLPFCLTPVKHYVGKAWYKKTINIQEDKLDPYWVLFLERPHITTKVWINGKALAVDSKENSLCVPHRWYTYNVLQPGENTIVICVDNDPQTVKVGIDSHSVTDQTQGCWNGIVGKIELQKPNYISSIQVYPDVDTKTAKVKMKFDGNADEDATVTLIAESFNTAKRHIVASKPVNIRLSSTLPTMLEMTLDMGDDMLLWDEFCPQMYRLTVEVRPTKLKIENGKLKSGKLKGENGKVARTFVKETYFGMRKMEIRDKMFYINGKQIQLRGNVENCLFPLTGYPPTDLDSWVKLFETHKKWGLNHVRFHSYCPPEAAFLAADMVGIYIQPEGPSWPNHGVKLGRNEPIDTYLYEEAQRICDEYGNHPSFTFFAFGNEPAGNWVKWCNEHIKLIKDYDPRHIYPGFSVGGGWAWQPKAEFAVKAGARGLAEWVRSAPESMANFEDKITTYNGKDMPGTPITVPFVTHEMGQWCAFPNFDEIGKYKGVNKAGNFEIFRDLLKDNGMESRGKDFLLASGKLQALCYKYETERILRTPKYAGFQMLSLNDYSGQGTALVGVTDVFYDEKGYITAPEFREFCSRVVPLAKFPKFTYSNGDTFEADLQVSQYSGGDIKDATIHWEVREEQSGNMPKGSSLPMAQGDFTMQSLECGLQNIGRISVPLHDIMTEGKYSLTVYIYNKEEKNAVGRNHWNFWVYPEVCDGTVTVREPKVKQGKRQGSMFYEDIFITDSLDAQAQKVLKKGGKVLILAHGKTTYGKEVKQQFLPVFWNTSWFKMRPPHTTGLFIEQEHPVFSTFPTDSHSDLQWWELVNNAPVMQFTDFPKDFQPIVQSIDTWFVSRKIGMLFEARVGKGRLMMTTMDLSKDLEHRLVASNLRSCILGYMQQDDKFQPKWTIDQARIADLFTKVAGEVNMFTNDSPDELKPKLK